MMLFDPEVGLSIKGGSVAGRREGKGGNECNSETNRKENRFEECQVAAGVRPEKSHLTPEVKIVNERACDHVWDKLHPPVSVTCSKWYIRKASFVLGAQPLDANPLSSSQPA
jgi:hypothetical protein